MLAKKGYTKKFLQADTDNAAVYLQDKNDRHNYVTSIVVVMSDENNNQGCCIFGQEANDDFASVKIEYVNEPEPLCTVTSAELHFFQGVNFENIESEWEIIGAIPVNLQQVESLVGLKAIEI